MDGLPIPKVRGQRSGIPGTGPGWWIARPRAARSALAGLALVLALAALPADGRAEGVQVFDSLAVQGGEIPVRVFTGTGPFPAGGSRVWLSVEGSPETLILTGGDGFGYWRMPAEKAGLFTVRVRTDQSGATGLIRVLGPGEKPVLVELESGLGLRRTLGDAGALTRGALAAVGEAFPLVYWSERAGLTAGRAWIRYNGCPEGPVLTDSLEALVRRLDGQNSPWQAVVGGKALLEALAERAAFAFSFEKTDAGRQVESWQDIREALLP